MVFSVKLTTRRILEFTLNIHFLLKKNLLFFRSSGDATDGILKTRHNFVTKLVCPVYMFPGTHCDRCAKFPELPERFGAVNLVRLRRHFFGPKIEFRFHQMTNEIPTTGSLRRPKVC